MMGPEFFLTGLLVVGFLFTGGLLLRLFLRLLGAIPVAYAWNPESHEKFVHYALEILRREQRPTLLGWVLQRAEEKQKRGRRFFHQHGILQLVRGSIDEDMNSDFLVSLEPTWRWLEGHLGTLTALAETPLSALEVSQAQAMRPDSHGSQQAVRAVVQLLKPWKDIEGTNGGYHYHTPDSRNQVKGLSDPVRIAILIQEKLQEPGWARGITRPMPSASDRARQEHTPEGWWMDREGRNYTVGDATRYYALGYLHLALYAAGRVAHLVQDMAVPAHVRDDAHFGMLDNPADPLEYFAGDEDWKAQFGASGLDPKSYKRGRFLRWVFDPQRVWDPGTQSHHLQEAEKRYQARNDEFRRQTADDYAYFFDTFARETHARHYSRGTIPGNADAHNPNDPEERLPWVPAFPPDLARCKPSIGALFTVFDVLRGLAAHVIAQAITMRGIALNAAGRVVDWGHLIDPDYGRRDVARPSSEAGSRMIEEELHGWLERHQAHQVHCQQIEALVSDFRQGLRPNVPEIMDHLEAVEHLLQELRGIPLSPYMTGAVLQEADAQKIAEEKKALDAYIDAYHQRYQYLRPQLLVGCLQGRALQAAMAEYIRQHPDRRELALAFLNTHGPCCLISEREDHWGEDESNLTLMRQQYDDCESSAIALTALFLVPWFESLYSAAPRLGVTLWQNQHTQRGQDIPEIGVVGAIENEQQIDLPEHLLTLGVANNLPVEIDLEISLLHIAPEEVDESYAFAQEVFPEGVPLSAWIHQAEGSQTVWRETIDGRISLTDGRPTQISVKDLLPHSGPAMEALRLPERGGILRENEAEQLVPIPPNPAEAQDRSRVAAAVVRIEFGEQKADGG